MKLMKEMCKLELVKPMSFNEFLGAEGIVSGTGLNESGFQTRDTEGNISWASCRVLKEISRRCDQT